MNSRRVKYNLWRKEYGALIFCQNSYCDESSFISNASHASSVNGCFTTMLHNVAYRLDLACGIVLSNLLFNTLLSGLTGLVSWFISQLLFGFRLKIAITVSEMLCQLANPPQAYWLPKLSKSFHNEKL